MGGVWGLAIGLLLISQAGCFNYKKYFQAFRHEIDSELVQNFEPEIESDDFTLDCVISGRDARLIRQVSALHQDASLAFDLSLLQIPNEIPPKLPSHKVKFTTGFASLLESYTADPSSVDDSFQKARTTPGLLPRPDDHETITNFAMMCSNAYIIHSVLGDWRNMTDYEQNKSDDFGWDGTGLRGYVFSNKERSIAIVAFKGTSTLFGGGDTVAEDKYIDNLMFSCCCARVDISWTPVCGCYMGSNKCNQTCLEESVLSSEVSYYEEAKSVVNLVKQKYPRAQLWFTGHSLGGSMAALMAIAFPRTAAITWESPGASLYAQRLGLHSSDPKDLVRYPIWNYGLNVDPIFTGTCSGITTSCYISGYAMESKCRQGQDCMFELKNRIANINSHRIDWVIENVLMRPDKYPMPKCVPNLNCTECEDWQFLRTPEETKEL